MKICSPQLGLAKNSILGGEVYDREILTGLSKKGVKIEILLPQNAKKEIIKNFNIMYLPINHFPAFLFNLLVIPYLFYVYRKQKFTILRLHSPQYVGFGALIFKLFHRKVKLIACYHQFRESQMYGLGNYLNKYWDFIITDSEFVKNKIISTYDIPAERIQAIYNGVAHYLKPEKKSKYLKNKYKTRDKFILLFMGLFIERKNPILLINILKKIKDKNILLIFIGEGPLRRQIIISAKEAGVYDQIIVLKPLYGPEKVKLLNLADVFVHPALDEGFPLSPLEAMACAKPAILNNGWSSEEMITNGVNGFIANDLNEWVSAIKILKNAEVRSKIGRNAYLKVKKDFRWKTAVDKHFEIFANLN